MTKHILITRAQSQAKEFADLCIKKEIVPVCCPMIAIKELPFNFSDIKEEGESNLLVFTSVNAVSLDILSHFKNAEISVIGKKTAKAVESFEFYVSHISSQAEENNLAEELVHKYSESERVIHIFQGNTSSSHVFDFLKSKGFKVHKHVVYEVARADYPREMLKEFLSNANQKPDFYFISLLSVHTAEIFFQEVSDLIGVDGVGEIERTLTFVTLSEKVARVLRNRGCKSVKVSSSKDIAGVLDLISMA